MVNRASWRTLGPAGSDAPECCLLGFDAASFDVGLFAAHGIGLPPTIAASVRKRQAEFFYGRYAARMAIARLDAAAALPPPDAPEDIAIGAGREPLWPARLIGSISHNCNQAGAVVLPRGPHRGIGIDIESVVDAATLQALLSMAISPGELADLHVQAGALPLTTLATMVFSAKESLYKGAFATVGRFFDFSAARLTALDLARRQLSLTLCENLVAPFTKGSVWTVHFELIDAGTVLTSFIWPPPAP